MIHHARYEVNNDVVILNINRRPFNYRSVSTSETCSNQADLGRGEKTEGVQPVLAQLP